MERLEDVSVENSIDDLRVVHAPETADEPVDDLRIVRTPEPSPQRSKVPGASLGLALSDMLCLLVAVNLASWGRPLDGGSYLLNLFAVASVWLLVFHAAGLYTSHLSAGQEARRLIGAVSLGVVLAATILTRSEPSLPHQWVGLLLIFAFTFELGARRLWRRLVARLTNGEFGRRTLIVGTNEEAAAVAYALEPKELAYVPLGFVAASGPHVSPNGLPVMGSLDDMRDAIREHGIDCVFVAASAVDESQMQKVIRTARREQVAVRVTANLGPVLSSRLRIEPVGNLPTVSLKPVRLTGAQAALKRLFDVVAASTALIVASPILAAAALAIRLSSPGPVFFRQPRVTKDGHTFTMLKFRTMVEDADRMLKERGIDPSQPFFKLQDDPRLTTVGRLLRRSSLDELPQLLNVVRGEMSLVGPRPLPKDQVAAHPRMLTPRLEVRAGITGWWQINGRSEVAPEHALRMDLFYIENWSLHLDLLILFKTLGVVLARKGAH